MSTARAEASGQSLLAALFTASRPLSWINTAFPFAAASLLTVREIDVPLVVGTVFFLVPYNLAMYGINDVFDFESDARNPRKGGVEGALLPPGRHRAVLIAATVLTVPFVVWLVLLGDPWSWAWLALSLFAVVAYSAPGLRFKEIPGLDSLTSSTHFVSPACYGLALAGATVTPQLVLLLAAFFVWGVASHAFGAVQDVVPDREAGIGSIATALGARRTTRLAIGLWLLAGVLMLGTSWPGPLAAVLAVPYLVAAWPYRSVSDAESARANSGWRWFLAINYGVGFAATMLLIWYALLTAA
jgi:4-hydroxybenzoate polyprenyltransferase